MTSLRLRFLAGCRMTMWIFASSLNVALLDSMKFRKSKPKSDHILKAVVISYIMLDNFQKKG